MDASCEPTVDQSVVKVGQASTIAILVIAFIANLWPLVAAAALIGVLGALQPAISLWRALYRYVLKPAGIVKPNVIADHPEPYRFAQGVGAVLDVIATVLLLFGLPVAGWALVWIHIALAALNLFADFCVGCFTYYQLNRLGIPGFSQSPIEGGTT